MNDVERESHASLPQSQLSRFMTEANVRLSPNEIEALRLLSTDTGLTEEEIIRAAIRKFVDNSKPESRLQLLKGGRGIWRERDDIPNARLLRDEMDRRERRP